MGKAHLNLEQNTIWPLPIPGQQRTSEFQNLEPLFTFNLGPDFI